VNEVREFVLVSIMDNSLMGHWAFQATDELAVARFLVQNAWRYQDVFWALRIPLKEAERVPPEDLLRAIRGSYADSHRRAVLHLIATGPVVNCAEVGQEEPSQEGVHANAH
jgi:hypothetical protein